MNEAGENDSLTLFFDTSFDARLYMGYTVFQVQYATAQQIAQPDASHEFTRDIITEGATWPQIQTVVEGLEAGKRVFAFVDRRCKCGFRFKVSK